MKWRAIGDLRVQVPYAPFLSFYLIDREWRIDHYCTELSDK